MLVKCKHCGLQESVAWLDRVPAYEKFFYQCSNGCDPSETGFAQQIRNTLEAGVGYDMPRVTSLRAMALSYKIYGASEASKYEWLTLSKRTTKALHDDSNSDQIVNQYPVFGRSWRGLQDSSLTAMIVVFKNPGELPPYSIYVVFRGSRGDKNAGGAGFMGGKPSGGGQSKASQTVNIDWRANFDNVQDFADYGGGGFLIHGGYKSVVASYRDAVYAKVAQARRAYPGSNVVITGHSQGAGHAAIFTHWLAYKAPELVPSLYCIPFSPPRVGDYRFAQDFNNRIVARQTVLPYDGMPSLGAMFVARGHDPVSFKVEQAYAFKSLDDPRGHETSLRKWASKGLLSAGLKAQHKEKKYGGEGLQVYFHPQCLKILPGAFGAIGQLQILNHKPDWIRNVVRKEFKSTA